MTTWRVGGSSTRPSAGIPTPTSTRLRNGGPGSGGHAWSTGNAVTPLVHGATVLPPAARGAVRAARRRPGPLHGLARRRRRAPRRAGHEIGEVLARPGAQRRARSAGCSGARTRDRRASTRRRTSGSASELNEAGGEVLLDQRVRRVGSHHQKLVVIRHRDDPGRRTWRSSAASTSATAAATTPRTAATRRRGHGPTALRARGRRGTTCSSSSAVRPSATCCAHFRERWDDPHPLDQRSPYRMLLQRAATMPRHPQPLPDALPGARRRPDRTPCRCCAPTRPKRAGYPFAPDGERSIARAYAKAFGRARSLIYLEDQYLWSSDVAAAARRRAA